MPQAALFKVNLGHIAGDAKRKKITSFPLDHYLMALLILDEENLLENGVEIKQENRNGVEETELHNISEPWIKSHLLRLVDEPTHSIFLTLNFVPITTRRILAVI